MSEKITTSVGIATLKRSNRRTLAISVLPNGSLELVAPLDASNAEILARVERRKRWIAKHRKTFKEWDSEKKPRRYVTGATHRYIGRQYRLKILSGDLEGVVLRGGFLHVTAKRAGDAEVKRILESWYRIRAREQFGKRLFQWADWCRRSGLPTPNLRIRVMSKRWGSACRDGTIQLSPELIRASSACIDYVIAHEVCHLKHPDHGPRFRSLLQSLCPNHVGLKARLEQMD